MIQKYNPDCPCIVCCPIENLPCEIYLQSAKKVKKSLISNGFVGGDSFPLFCSIQQALTNGQIVLPASSNSYISNVSIQPSGYQFTGVGDAYNGTIPFPPQPVSSNWFNSNLVADGTHIHDGGDFASTAQNLQSFNILTSNGLNSNSSLFVSNNDVVGITLRNSSLTGTDENSQLILNWNSGTILSSGDDVNAFLGLMTKNYHDDAVGVGLGSIPLLQDTGTTESGHIEYSNYPLPITAPVTDGDYVIKLNKVGTTLTSTFEEVKIDLLPDYSTARTTLGDHLEDEFVINDFTYIADDGNTYTTEGGLFRKVTSGTENGGTILVLDDSTIIERVWNKINIKPEWWEINGIDENGNTYISKENINGIHSETSRLKAAVNVVGEGGIIELLSNKIYEVDSTWIILPGQKIYGNNATLFRKADPFITFTGTGTTITVSDSSNLRAGQTIHLGGPNSGDSSFVTTINSISGNVLTVSGTVPVLAENQVHNAIIMVRQEQPGTINIQYLNFDGNRDNVQKLRWDGGSSGIIVSTEEKVTEVGAIIEHCTFRNIPQDCIFIGGGIVRNCFAENLNSSFIHTNLDKNANGQKDQNEVERYGLIIKDNTILNSCEEAVNNGHAEGVISFSNVSINVDVINNRIYNSGAGVFGTQGSDDGIFNAVGNIAANCESIITFGAFAGSDFNTLTIKDNQFYSCGDIITTSTGVIRNINISNNKIYNGRLRIDNVKNVIVDENIFAWVSNLYGFVDFGGTSTSGTSAWVVFNGSNIENLSFCNNSVIGDADADHDSEYIHGVLLFRPDAYTTTNGYVDSANIKFNGNTIANFKRGISFGRFHTTINVPTLSACKMWECKNNKVVMWNDTTIFADQSWGIYPYAGAIVTDNIVFMPETSPSNSYGIIAPGIDDTSNPANIMGAIVRNNYIFNGDPAHISNTPILIGARSSGTVNRNNIIVSDNYSTRPIWVQAAHAGTVENSNNKVLSTVLPIYTAPSTIIPQIEVNEIEFHA